MNTPRTTQEKRSLVLFILGSALLCSCTVLQLELATVVIGRVWKTISPLRAAPPVPISVMFPWWVSAARWPWELMVVVVYLIPTITGLRKNVVRAVMVEAVVWLAGTTVFFFVAWLAALPFKSCCV
jgi:hypothetical protein